MSSDPSPLSAPGGDGASASHPEGGGPVLRLLARGLELWLRQQCDSIGHLEIQLSGSAAALLRGRPLVECLRWSEAAGSLQWQRAGAA